MKILITNTGPWGTGSGTVADGVMKELLRRGHEVKAFFPDSGFPGKENEKYYGNLDKYHIVKFPVRYHGINLYTFPLIIEDPNPRNFKNAWTFKKLSRAQLKAYFNYMNDELKCLLNDFKPDIIECQHIWAIDHLIHKMNYEYICVAHHSDQLGFIYDKRMQALTKRSAKHAKYIFAISDYVKNEVMSLYNIPSKQIIVTGNGYDQTVFFPENISNRQKVLNQFGFTHFNDYPIITFCGKISYTKGIDLLLQANKYIQSKMKVNLFLMGSGNLDIFTQKEKNSFHLENVYFLGHRSQTECAQLHNIAHHSVLPSRTEGFGIAALEAMGCQKPVVVTNVGGLPSFVVGKIVATQNHQSLAVGIIELLSMPKKDYHCLCEKAFLTAQHYSWKNIVDIRMRYYSN